MKFKTVIPRKNPKQKDWFEKLHKLNKDSVKNRKKWQERGIKKVSGWAVMKPDGTLLPSTFSIGRHTAMKRCMEPAFRRFNGVMLGLFSEWEKVGYQVVKVRWEVEK